MVNILLVSGLAGCQVLSSGVPAEGVAGSGRDAAVAANRDGAVSASDVEQRADASEPPGVAGPLDVVGCSDGTREGFRDFVTWQTIAGCAGGWDQPGVIGSPELSPVCGLNAGDSSPNPNGKGCNAADLCAKHWHLCLDGYDVFQHSPSGDCESCVPANEPRFFLVGSGASPMGICSPEPSATNDLHGCGGLGEPETEACYPLFRRMGFADCLATGGVWSCGDEADYLQEAMKVTKTGPTLGGVLCCQD
jgi:hypothetical protein